MRECCLCGVLLVRSPPLSGNRRAWRKELIANSPTLFPISVVPGSRGDGSRRGQERTDTSRSLGVSVWVQDTTLCRLTRSGARRRAGRGPLPAGTAGPARGRRRGQRRSCAARPRARPAPGSRLRAGKSKERLSLLLGFLHIK